MHAQMSSIHAILVSVSCLFVAVTLSAADCERYYEEVHGSYPYIVILLKFKDISDEPQCSSPYTDCWDYFTELFGTNYPGLDHYWRTVSYGHLNLEGTSVLPQWYTLPKDRSDYTDGEDDDLDLLAQDGASVADADVDFRRYAGIAFILNGSLGANRGRRCEMTLDGETPRVWNVIFIKKNDYGADVVAHEIGHSLSMPWHSCEPSTNYGSRWDVVSEVAGKLPSDCQYQDSVFGCIPVHPIAYHKFKSGWIPSANRIEAPSGTTKVVTIERLEQENPISGYIMATIPMGTHPNGYYTVEARKRADAYEQDLPGEAILIHQVDASSGIPYNTCDARVMDADNNGDANDAGAMWLPGETYYDTANNVMISVLDEAGTGWQVGLSRSPRNPCYVDIGNTGTEDGSAAHPFNTILEGIAAVVPERSILIKPGAYPERLKVRKPCRLERNGSAGTVIIGR